MGPNAMIFIFWMLSFKPTFLLSTFTFVSDISRVCCVLLHAQSCPTVCDPTDCSLPRSFVCGSSQVRILEWVSITISFKIGFFRVCIRVSSQNMISPTLRISYPYIYHCLSGEWKSWLKAQHSENEDHGIWSHHFMGNRWGNSGNSVRLYFSGLQNHYRMVTAAMKLKDTSVLAPHSSTLAWKIPWTEESGRLQSMRSLRVGHD